MSGQNKLLSAAILLALSGSVMAAGNPAERALGFSKSHASDLKASPNDTFTARAIILDSKGAEHVRMDRKYKGLEVFGGDIIIHSRDGAYLSSTHTMRTNLNLDIKPTLLGSAAIEKAAALLGGAYTNAPKAELLIYARGNTPALAYRVNVLNDSNDMVYIIDAKSGRLLDRWTNIQTAAAVGTGKTLYLGNVAVTTNSVTGSYQMVDPSRGSGSTYDAKGAAYNRAARGATLYTDADNIWGNNLTSDGATVAADAHYGVAATWDYYLNVHGRSGIFANGVGAKSYVHVGRGWDNASWYANAMYYGDGNGSTWSPLVVVDVAGHEMSHGVMQATANLTYSGESGGLNEANSDIMGTNVEFFANNAADTPDYEIGEKIYIANNGSSVKALRYMFNPIKDGASPNCYTSSIGSLNVHYSSGVANHFYYLLAEGSGAKTFSGVDHTSPTCNGQAVTGITRAKAEKIWYRATSVYMTSSTNYAGARTATLNAASDLYGAASAERAAVAAAWSAVSVN